MSNEDFYKAIYITSKKRVNMDDIANSTTLKDYNDLVIASLELTEDEFILLKEVSIIWKQLGLTL